MRRISAIFIAVCMVLIAGSLGAVLFLGLKIDARTSAIVALAALTGMALYQYRQQPPARPRRSRRPDRRPLARHRRPRPPGGARFRAGSTPWRDASSRPRTARAARSIRSPPRSANWAPWCGRSPTRVASHAAALQQQGALPAPAAPGAAPAADGALALSESDAVSGAPLPQSEPRRHRRADRQGGRRQPHRSLSAADRHAAAAQGALLRGAVAPAHRGGRHHRRRRLHRLRRKRRPDAEDRQSPAVPLRAGDAPPAIEEPRRRRVLQCQRLDAERSVVLPAVPRFHGRQPRAQRRADVRIHAKRLSHVRAARARKPGGAGRARLPLLHGSRHRPAHGAEGIGRPLVPLPQSAGQAAAQPGRRRAKRHPSRRSRRPAGALRHRSHRRAHRKREHGGRPARLRRALRPGLPVLAPRPVRAEACKARRAICRANWPRPAPADFAIGGPMRYILPVMPGRERPRTNAK